MAAMAINSKNLYKSYSSGQNRKTYDFETLPEVSVNGALQSCTNHDPLMTDLFYGKVSLGRISQISGERL